MEEKFDSSGSGYNDMNEVNPPLSRAGGILFSASAVMMSLVGIVFALIVKGVGIQEETDAYVYLSYLASPVALSISMFLVIKLYKLKVKNLFPVKCSPKYYLIAVLLIFGLLFFAGLVDKPVLELFKLMGYKPRLKSDYFPNLQGGLIVPALLVMAVMPAVFEEAMFRGVLLHTCEDGMGSIRTVFIVGFCFSLFHTSPEQTVYPFIAGCAFAFLAIKSGSILPSVFMHFLNNALLVILAKFDLYDTAGEIIMPDTVSIVVTCLAAVSFVAAAVWLILDKKPLKKCCKGGVKNFFIFAAAGIFILALSWVLSFFKI